MNNYSSEALMNISFVGVPSDMDLPEKINMSITAEDVHVEILLDDYILQSVRSNEENYSSCSDTTSEISMEEIKFAAETLIGDENFVAETLMGDENFVAETPDFHNIPLYDSTADTLMAATITDYNHIPFSFEISAEYSIPEAVEDTNQQMISINQDNLVETTSAADIPMYFFDFDTKALRLNENIIIETLEADDSAELSDDNSNNIVETVDVVKINPFYCVECDKNFYKSGPYTQHRNVHHTDEKNQIKCNICGKRFPTEEALQNHVIKHDDKSRTFKCQICPKAYVHKVDLKRHKLSHEPKDSKPYQCDKCDKGFVRKDHFSNHKQSHIRKEILKAKKNVCVKPKKIHYKK